FVMSDSEDSTVTYTEVSSPFEDLSDIGSSGVDGLPMMLKDPYVEAALQAPPSPNYPIYPEFMPPEDDVLPTEEQPLPTAVSPTADSPSFITEPDPKEDQKENDEDLEEDPTDYPDDKDYDDDDDDDMESSGDNADDEEEDEDEDEDEEEEEHPAPADSVPPPVHRILSPPLPISPPPLPASLTRSLGYRAALIRLRDESPSTSHPLPLSTPPSRTPPLLPIPLPTSSPPLLLPSTVCRADDEIRRDPEREVGYRITDTWDKMFEDMQGTPTAIDVAGLSQRMTDFVTTVRHDTNEIYKRLDDAQDDRLLMSGQLNMLRGDRYAHARTPRLMETEAILSREAWVQSMDASDTARSELTEALTLLRTLQTPMAVLQSQQTPARKPARPEIPKEAAPKRTTRSTPATTTTPTTSVTDEKLKRLISQGVADVLAEREATRSGNGKDIHDSGMGGRRQAPLAREYTYLDFMKFKPLYFKGTEGVVELSQFFERMEIVFRISNCTVENQIKFAICTLLGSALTWWNSHV
ncbi:hypothetical protein Tco_1435560, partial [Tanacetum coccineum]